MDFRYVTSLGADGAEEVYEFIVDNYMTGQDDDYYEYNNYYEYDNYQYDDYYNKYNNYKDIKGFSYDRMEWYFNSIRDTYKEKVRSVDLTSQGTRQRSMQNVSLNGTGKKNKVR